MNFSISSVSSSVCN